MDNSACVSVVVPVYNQEEYLEESVGSLLDQSYRNLQIVLVNDGSTDAGTEMLRHFAQRDARVTLVEKENGGLVDALLAGIATCRGEYICFLDPDDLLGRNFVETFMENIRDDCDFVAAGYYTDHKGVLTPRPLKEDRVFSAGELRVCADSFLRRRGEPGISHRFFISRWNKLYRGELVRKVAEKLGGYRHISLGEDTLFTYLVLNCSRGGRVLARPNSYFYNVGNTKSMMRTGEIGGNLKKAWDAFAALKTLTAEFSNGSDQAWALYGFLVDGIASRAPSGDRKQLLQKLRGDENYRMAVRLHRSPAEKRKRWIPEGVRLQLKNTASWLRTQKGHMVFWCKTAGEKGLLRATRLLKFRSHREKAFAQLNTFVPMLEKRIYPMLRPFLSETTDPDVCPLQRNVFVFWWDGFEKAPPIVRSCLRSVRAHHRDCRVIPIDKNNFRDYTDIHPAILKAFGEDKISVQSFSDVLRFNLLKNNGGVWVDATIFFTAEYNLLEDLEEKPFTSLAFSTSADFFRYGDDRCTWSGFFMASRKNSVFTRAVDHVFRQYFLRYGNYATYFFIDIVMMLCKKYRLDGDALSRTLYTNRSMFALTPLLGEAFDPNVIAFTDKIPQKLIWNVGDIPTEGTFYGWLLRQNPAKAE